MNPASIMFIEEAQEDDWNSLHVAMHCALSNGSWSTECGDLAARIVIAAHLVGPTHWSNVPYALICSGLYHALLEQAGVEPACGAEPSKTLYSPQWRSAVIARYGQAIPAMRADSFWKEMDL